MVDLRNRKGFGAKTMFKHDEGVSPQSVLE